MYIKENSVLGLNILEAIRTKFKRCPCLYQISKIFIVKKCLKIYNAVVNKVKSKLSSFLKSLFAFSFVQNICRFIMTRIGTSFSIFTQISLSNIDLKLKVDYF